MNDAGVTMIAHLAYGSWNVDAVDHYAGHIGGRGHGGHVGRGYDHNSAFHSRGHDHRRVCRGHFRSRVNVHHNLSGSHSLFSQARNSASHVVSRHGDNRLLLVHPSQNEKDRASFCGEDGVRWGGKSYYTVGGAVAVGTFEGNVDVCLEQGDLEELQNRA